MSDEILLDIRSGDRNSSSTDFGLRFVDGSVEENSGSYIRRYRDYHDMSVFGDIAFISSGDSELGKTTYPASFTPHESYENYYYTGIRSFCSAVYLEGGIELETLYGGSMVYSELDLSVGGYGVGGLGFWGGGNVCF